MGHSITIHQPTPSLFTGLGWVIANVSAFLFIQNLKLFLFDDGALQEKIPIKKTGLMHFLVTKIVLVFPLNNT